MKKVLLLITLSILILSGAVTATVIFFHGHNEQAGIPKTVLKKASFSVFTIDPTNKTWQLDKNATTYDTSQGLLTLHFSNAQNKIVVNQQATPDPFNDIPNYYTILLNKLHEYSEIHTNIGTVGLTHPEELKGKQSAVINTKGTLMFVSPDKDLTNDQWRQFFNSLEVVK